MKQVWQLINKSIIGLKRDMKFNSSIKQKHRLLIVTSILLTTFLTYSLLNIFYLNSHERNMKIYIGNLLTEIDTNNLQKSIDWTEASLNLNIYVLENVEDLLSKIPLDIDKKRVLSDSDIQQLERGNTVINKLKTPDLSLNLLVFIHPIIENNEIENLLFIHVPINNIEEDQTTFAGYTTLLAILSVGLTILITKKTLGKSYRQLKDIKLAAVEVSKGNFDAKIWTNSSDEIGEITEVFNSMSIALKNDRIRTKEFMEDISHEIKTPLALVKSYNQALMDQMIQGQEEQQKCYHVIDRETNRLQKLIQNFLDFSKLDAQSVELQRQPMVLAQSIEEMMMKYKLIFDEKNIKLNMKLDYAIIIHADEERLEQIFQNIIQNAIRYSKDEASIDIIVERKATTCVVAISDNGVGISEEHLSVITNRFIRVNKVHSRNESGTGLGLSIVEKLMTLHGGKMTIESELGVGTTVKLEFPIITLDEE